jgi:flavin reductase
MIDGVSRGEELRRLMRRFPSGVAVVTVDADGERVGLTVASLVSLSLEPPLVGVAIGRNAALHELLRAAGAFAVSLLAGGQEAIAAHFARGVPPIALWAGVPTRPAAQTGAPLLDGALGWIECRTAAEHPVGDHTLFVGEVLTVEIGTPARPLVYVDQAYATA